MRTTTISAITLAGVLALAGCSSDAGAGTVSFGGVADGDTVASPVAVTFEADGFEIVPAAEGGGDGSGHLHVMIDTDCVPVGETIPNDDEHLHFGDGSTSTELELTPGDHTLCLQAGDGEHTAMDVTDEVTITVE